MKSVIASFAVAVLAGLVDAKASFTNTEFDVQAGQSFTLTWEGGSGPFTVNLKDGPSTDLSTVETLVSSTTGDSATITLPTSLASGTYAFEIVDAADGESNYSVQFTFAGSAASSSVTSASSTKSASSSAVSTTTVSSASTTTTESSSSASTSGSTTASSSTTVSTSTTSSSSTRTSSSASATTTAASVNAAGKSVPFLGGLVFAAGIAAAF